MLTYSEIMQHLETTDYRGSKREQWQVALAAIRARGTDVAAGVRQMRCDIEYYSTSTKKTAPKYKRAAECVLAVLLGL